MTKGQAAEALQCSQKTIESHIKANRLTAVNVGLPNAKRPAIRVTKESLDRFIQRHTLTSQVDVKSRRKTGKPSKSEMGKWFGKQGRKG